MSQHSEKMTPRCHTPTRLALSQRAAERAGEDLGGVTENYNTETLDNLPTSLTRSWAPTGPVRIPESTLQRDWRWYLAPGAS